MKCPNCKDNKLSDSIKIGGMQIQSCPVCRGLWFKKDELRKVKDSTIKDANWFDVDLWKDISKFSVVEKDKDCLVCGIPLYNIKYGESDIAIDACQKCQGIWLDKGEFVKIINYIKEKSSSEVINQYADDLFKEVKEVIKGPEGFVSELKDLLVLTNLFKYKFAAEHPLLTILFEKLPFTK